jgi:hypothetical protein
VGDAEHLGHGHRPAGAALAEGPAFDVLHDQVVVIALVEHVVELHDGRVVDAGRDPGLAAKPLAAIGRGGVVGAQALDGDEAIQALVVGQDHLSHPADSQSPDDAVGADSFGIRHRDRADHDRPSSWIRRRSAALDGIEVAAELGRGDGLTSADAGLRSPRACHARTLAARRIGAPRRMPRGRA